MCMCAFASVNRYGIEDSGLELSLVYNPVGAFLPPPQESLEAAYKVSIRTLSMKLPSSDLGASSFVKSLTLKTDFH